MNCKTCPDKGDNCPCEARLAKVVKDIARLEYIKEKRNKAEITLYIAKAKRRSRRLRGERV